MTTPDSDYRVQYLDDKNTKIRGSIAIDDSGFATIFINPRLDPERQYKTLVHELNHLNRNDAFNNLSIYEVENKPEPVHIIITEPLSPRPSLRAKTPPSRKLSQTPQDHLIQRFYAVQGIIPMELHPALADLFSRPPASMAEVKLRGWLLYGLDEDNSHWKQIHLTHALYGTKLPHRADPEASRLLKGAIPHETMKRVIYALFESLSN